MVTVVYHPQPGVLPRFGDTLEPLAPERVGAAPDRPAIVTHLVDGQRHRIPARVGQQSGAERGAEGDTQSESAIAKRSFRLTPTQSVLT